MTSLAVSSDDNTIAAGYSNGLVTVWNITTANCNTTLRYSTVMNYVCLCVSVCLCVCVCVCLCVCVCVSVLCV